MPTLRHAKTADGVRIAFYAVGDGPAVVMLFPYHVNHLALNWQVPLHRGAIEFFARYFKVVNLDFRGAGLSDRHISRLSLATCADDLDSVRLHEDVAIDPSSKLASASGRAPLDVNSRHHQAVTSKELAPSLRATATVGELIEAFESDKYRWLVGVQWHPERIGKDQGMSPEVEGVFDAFVQEAARTTTASR